MPNKPRHGTKPASRMAARRLKTRRACAKGPPARCTSLTFAIPTATSWSGFIACRLPDNRRSTLKRAALSGRPSRAKDLGSPIVRTSPSYVHPVTTACAVTGRKSQRSPSGGIPRWGDAEVYRLGGRRLADVRRMHQTGRLVKVIFNEPESELLEDFLRSTIVGMMPGVDFRQL